MFANWRTCWIVCAVFLAGAAFAVQADEPRYSLHGHVPAVVNGLTPKGLLPETNMLQLAVGLPLRNPDQLDQLLHQLYDPASTNYHKFLSVNDFADHFGPTEQQYKTVRQFLESHGFEVIHTHANRLVLDVRGTAASAQQAFAVSLHVYRHPTEPRDFFAPEVEPSVPTNVPVNDLWGLSDYARPTPLAHLVPQSKISPASTNGTGPGGTYWGRDFRNAYAPGVPLVGSGQIGAVAEFDGYYSSDIATYEADIGYTNVPLQNTLLNGVSGTPGYSGVQNAVAEVSLDIELQIAMAPALSKMIVYEGNNPYTVFSQIASDNTAKQISCSWSFGYGPSQTFIRHNSSSTLDNALMELIAQGQSFFEASGDNCAYTGSEAVNSSSGPIPVDSIYVTSVGGTSLSMDITNASYTAETVWNWGGNQGSGGGVSSNYGIPYWQASVSMAANSGSTVYRNFPDVALTADDVEVIYNNGSSGDFGGTSCAAPLWAGFTALVNQQSIASGSNSVGFLNPALYTIAAGPNYANAFHDVTTGNNIGSHTPGLYYAVPNYDLATGLGTPNGLGMVYALAPAPAILGQPVSQNIAAGATVTLGAVVSAAPPIAFQWLFNGTNLPASGNVSGVDSTAIVISGVTTNNAGSYRLIFSNAYGAVTSAVAVLIVGLPPVFLSQPTNLILLAGSTAVFSASGSGSSPLGYQWQHNNTNLINGANTSGVTTNTLTLSNISSNNTGNYTLMITNAFGTNTSSVASLTVVYPPGLTASSLTNRTIQCGTNVSYNLTISGTTPLSVQWSLDAVPIPGATGTSLSLTNIHLPSHTVSVVVTNLYGNMASNATLTVVDTLPPVVTLNGASRLTNQFEVPFVDPGATAFDQCAGVVPVVTNGTVNVNVAGTNTLTYTANDGNGNTGSVARVVVVVDTNLPVIVYSFTNLFLSLNTNCAAPMPNVTGTNDILATDIAGPPVITQSPVTNAALALGTNLVILTATDMYGNVARSTNHVIVSDTTPPMFTLEPLGQTNLGGTTVTFNAAATACSTIAYQWRFNGVALTNQTQPSLTLSNLVIGQSGGYSVVATTVAGPATSSVAPLVVVIQTPTLALASSNNPDGYLTPLTFMASVSPTNATGTIAFFTNGAAFDTESLIAGSATSKNTAALPRGTNLITAVYSGDAADYPATNSLSQIVTNHPPVVVSPLTFRVVAGRDLTVLLTNLATNWSDVDGDALSLAGLTTSTNGITVIVTNPPPALFYADTNYVNDQFTCQVTDGYGGTNTEVINILIQPQTNSAPNISRPVVSSAGVTLTLGGAYNSTYVLESTTNLSGAWTPLATNQLGITGTWQFTDGSFSSNPRRFYRLELVL